MITFLSGALRTKNRYLLIKRVEHQALGPVCQVESVTNEKLVETKPDLAGCLQDPSVPPRKPFCWWDCEHQWRRSAGVKTRSGNTGSGGDTEPCVTLGLDKSQKGTQRLSSKSLGFFLPPFVTESWRICSRARKSRGFPLLSEPPPTASTLRD